MGSRCRRDAGLEIRPAGVSCHRVLALAEIDERKANLGSARSAAEVRFLRAALAACELKAPRR
jgi:hypothetical protein